MATTEKEVGEVYLKNVRLSFEHIWKKSASVEGGPLKYRASFIMDPNTPDGRKNIRLCEKAIAEVKDTGWPGKGDRIQFKADRMAFKDGNTCVFSKGENEGEVRPEYVDMMYVSANNDKRPKIKDRDGETNLEEEDGKIYGGAYVCAILRFYPIKDQKRGGNGIFCSLDGVQFFKKGDPFGNEGIDDSKFQNLGDDGDEDVDEPPARTAAKTKPKPGGRRVVDDDDDLLG